MRPHDIEPFCWGPGILSCLCFQRQTDCTHDSVCTVSKTLYITSPLVHRFFPLNLLMLVACFHIPIAWILTVVYHTISNADCHSS